MSTTASSNTSRRSFGLKACLMVAVAALAVVASAAPAAPAAVPEAFKALEDKCSSNFSFADYGDWAEGSCDQVSSNHLSTRADQHHFYSYKSGDSYIAVVEASWGTARSVTLSGSWSSIVNQPKRCSSGGEFCFDIYEDICIYYFSNKSWERYCGNWKSIDFWAS
ncbi:hypothetical protein BG011_006581 [Mortierella polycephala]|uniref:Uncharacterized protein n=1 Tax=Mortierella polycephala TaxID=41804 RepID=A0A9P6PSE0_9FUNG|nr:hypothetical protein BG011_006581 [Mortierella polycephala]